MSDQSEKIESIMHEARSFAPARQFSKDAHIKTEKAYEREIQRSIDSGDKFWAGAARKLDWFKKWDKELEWNPPVARWFTGGEINACHNCVDRHLATRGDHEAIIWEGEPGETKRITFKELHKEVCKFANVLKDNGVATGDRVALYMPMIPELAIAMLACARIGATHSIIFGGFSAQAIADRCHDAGVSAIVTADGGYRRGKPVPLKDTVDEAIAGNADIKKVFVVQRCRNDVKWTDGRDIWWHEAMAEASEDCPAERLDANHPLFILYTSGTTGKPKGIYHGTGGYLTYAYTTTKFIFDLKPDDIFWCTADIGWITGHSYVVYGALANGVTTVMYEGAPDYPDKDRFWNIIQKLRPTIFYTAPTAIRAFIKWGDEYVRGRDLSSLRLLGTVGEPINPEAWIWCHRKIGSGACPIVDTWWQTETGGIMISPMPGAIPTKPGSCTKPFFGVDADIFDEQGNPCAPEKGGYLVIKKPWPGMMLGVWGDEQRYKDTYWSKFGPEIYFPGDGAYKDKDGYFWVVGRIDDVVNISGHRLGTAEVESALVSHPKVAEAAVVGKPHELKGQCIEAFVSLTAGTEPSHELADELKAHVAKEIGALARPEAIRFTQALPKTRSGKIMRRLLRDIAAGKETQGDTTTLEDAGVLASIRATDED